MFVLRLDAARARHAWYGYKKNLAGTAPHGLSSFAAVDDNVAVNNVAVNIALLLLPRHTMVCGSTAKQLGASSVAVLLASGEPGAVLFTHVRNLPAASGANAHLQRYYESMEPEPQVEEYVPRPPPPDEPAPPPD